MAARLHGMEEVVGSTPIGSTLKKKFPPCIPRMLQDLLSCLIALNVRNIFKEKQSEPEAYKRPENPLSFTAIKRKREAEGWACFGMRKLTETIYDYEDGMFKEKPFRTKEDIICDTRKAIADESKINPDQIEVDLVLNENTGDLLGLLPNWLWLQFPSFGCAKFVNRRHTLSQVCLLFSHLARAKSENFASKPIWQQTLVRIKK